MEVEIVLLAIFAFMAGFIDSIAGGGGLIQLPALFAILPHYSVAQLLAMNKASSVAGTSMATWSYLRKISVNWKLLAPMVLTAFLASLFGAYLATRFATDRFKLVIAIVLVFVFLYSLFNKNFGTESKEVEITGRKIFLACLGIAAPIGFYDGLIGPGTGGFFIFLLIRFIGFDFLKAAASSKILNMTTNIAAISFFVSSGLIVWKIAIPMAICNSAGSFFGSRLAILKGSRFVRVIFLVVTSAFVVKMLVDSL